MSSDATLLHRYAHERAEDSFAELVRRHLDLVHSAALRQVGGDAHAAQDVAQRVFSELARHAARLAGHPALVGWLYTTTRRMALEIVRAKVRRERREQEAHAMQQLYHDSEPPPDWSTISPVLDAAMHELAEADRLAVLLRCFERRPFAEVGARLGLTENAARMRVDRALDKLRARLAQHGVTSTAAALAVVLGGPAVSAAPATLAASITAGALATGATATATGGMFFLMASAKLKAALAATLGVAALTSLVVQQHSLRELRAENAGLRERLSAVPAAPPTGTAGPVPDKPLPSAEDQAELVRLRGLVAQLQRDKLALSNRVATATPPAEPDTGATPAPVFTPVQFQDLGADTPDAAAQSFLWALQSENPERMIQLLDVGVSSSDGPVDQVAAFRDIIQEMKGHMEADGVRIGRLKSFREFSRNSAQARFEMDDSGSLADDFVLNLRRKGGAWMVQNLSKHPANEDLTGP